MPRLRPLALLIPAMFSVGAAAHHARVEFREQDVTELEGTLTKVDWRNPHPSFELRVDQGPRQGQAWQVQVFGAVNTLSRAGVEGEIFEVGQRVLLAGRPSSRRENYILGGNILLPGNYEVVLGRGFEPRWSENYVGGARGWEVDEEAVRAASAENKGIFRVWSPPSIEEQRAVRQAWRPLPFTEAALAARENWDVNDNPVTRCEDPWMPWTVFQPFGFEIVDNGDTINFDYVYYGATRQVYMQDPPPADEQGPSRMGFAVGRWDGDALIVETSRIKAPAFGANGELQTDAMTLTETFRLSEDQTRLHYELTMVDPVVFSEPATVQFSYVAIGEPFTPYLCEQ